MVCTCQFPDELSSKEATACSSESDEILDEITISSRKTGAGRPPIRTLISYVSADLFALRPGCMASRSDQVELETPHMALPTRHMVGPRIPSEVRSQDITFDTPPSRPHFQDLTFEILTNKNNLLRHYINLDYNSIHCTTTTTTTTYNPPHQY